MSAVDPSLPLKAQFGDLLSSHALAVPSFVRALCRECRVEDVARLPKQLGARQTHLEHTVSACTHLAGRKEMAGGAGEKEGDEEREKADVAGEERERSAPGRTTVVLMRPTSGSCSARPSR